VEFELQAVVERDPQRGSFGFTRRVRHPNAHPSASILLIPIAESAQGVSRKPSYLGNPGLLLIVTVLEQHSRALRTLLARAGRPELQGLLGEFERRERALREAAWELRRLGDGRTTGPRRRNGSDDGDPVRQGVLPLAEPTRTADAGVMGCVIRGLSSNGTIEPGKGGRGGRAEPDHGPRRRDFCVFGTL
jgi:hypothetical protein